MDRKVDEHKELPIWVAFRSCSVAKSCLTLQPHGLQHTRLPCPPVSLEFAQTHVHWITFTLWHFPGSSSDAKSLDAVTPATDYFLHVSIN